MTQQCRESKPGDNAPKRAVEHMGATSDSVHTVVTLARCKGMGGGKSHNTQRIDRGEYRGSLRLVSVNSRHKIHELQQSRDNGGWGSESAGKGKEEKLLHLLLLFHLVILPCTMTGRSGSKASVLQHRRTARDEGSRGLTASSPRGSLFFSAEKPSTSTTYICDYLTSLIVTSP